MTIRECMIDTIKAYQYYEGGVLESLTDEELKDVYESLLDWIGD